MNEQDSKLRHHTPDIKESKRDAQQAVGRLKRAELSAVQGELHIPALAERGHQSPAGCKRHHLVWVLTEDGNLREVMI